MSKKIRVILARNQKLINDYFDLREKYFDLEDINILKKNGFSVTDSFDKTSHIFVLLDNNTCVGGVRLNISNFGDNNIMPMETGHFRLKSFINDFNNFGYGELSRLVIDPNYRFGEGLSIIVKIVNVFCIAHDIRFLLAKATMLRLRNFRRAYQRLGLHFNVIEDLELPSFEITKKDSQLYKISGTRIF